MVSLIVACGRPGVLAAGPWPVWLRFIYQLKGRKRQREEERKNGVGRMDRGRQVWSKPVTQHLGG